MRGVAHQDRLLPRRRAGLRGGSDRRNIARIPQLAQIAKLVQEDALAEKRERMASQALDRTPEGYDIRLNGELAQ